MATARPPQDAQLVFQRIFEKMRSKGATGDKCPLCKTNKWILGSYVPLTTSNVPTEVVLRAQVYPLIAMICSNCGNTQLVNLLYLGFTPQEIQALRLPMEYG